MTNPTPHGQVPEALRLAEQYDHGAPAAQGDVLDEALRERDDAEDFIDALLDEVLGHERPEWSSSYGRADALNDVQERMTALHKPAVDKAWGQFQSAMAAPQQEAQGPVAVVVPCYTPSGKRVALYPAKQDLPIGTQLYTAPQPSPTAQGDAEDAARWHWIAEYLVGPRTDLDDEIVESETVNELRKLVDAIRARGAQGESNAPVG